MLVLVCSAHGIMSPLCVLRMLGMRVVLHLLAEAMLRLLSGHSWPGFGHAWSFARTSTTWCLYCTCGSVHGCLRLLMPSKWNSVFPRNRSSNGRQQQ